MSFNHIEDKLNMTRVISYCREIPIQNNLYQKNLQTLLYLKMKKY